MAEELDGSAVADDTQATTQEPASGGAADSTPSVRDQLASGLEGSSATPTTSDTPHLEEQTAQPSFLEQLAEFGDEFKDVTDESDARNRLLAHARAVREERQALQQWQQRAAPYVRAGQQYAAVARDPEYQAWVAQRQAARQQPGAQAAPQAAKEPEKWWNPPNFDKNSLASYVEHVVDPATNEVTPRFKADTPVEVRAAYAAHQKYLNDWQDGLSTRPQEVLPAIIRQEVAPLIEQYFAQREQQSRSQQFVSQVNEQNAEWLYQRDQNGQPLFDPVSREPLFTPAGARARQNVEWLQSIGVDDPQQRWFLATSLLHRDALLQSSQQVAQQQTQQTNADIAAQKKVAAVAAGNRPGANHIPNRGGSNPRQQSGRPLPQNGRLSVADQLRSELEIQGLGSATTAQLLGV